MAGAYRSCGASRSHCWYRAFRAIAPDMRAASDVRMEQGDVAAFPWAKSSCPAGQFTLTTFAVVRRSRIARMRPSAKRGRARAPGCSPRMRRTGPGSLPPPRSHPPPRRRPTAGRRRRTPALPRPTRAHHGNAAHAQLVVRMRNDFELAVEHEIERAAGFTAPDQRVAGRQAAGARKSEQLFPVRLRPSLAEATPRPTLQQCRSNENAQSPIQGRWRGYCLSACPRSF